MLRTFEFETNIENGMIVLPDNFKNVRAKHSKISVTLVEEDVISQKDALSDLFSKIRKQDLFSQIADASEWQKEMRNEWEERTF